MRAIVRGFAWFLGSIVVAAIVLRATVFDVWTVTELPRGRAAEAAPGDLAPGDVVVVLRDSKARAGNVARCAGTDGKTSYAMRVAPAPVGSSDPDDLPKPARIASPRTTPPKRARTTTRNVRDGKASPATSASPASAEQPAAKADPAKPESAEGDSCRRVVFRLWGENGPTDPAHRFNIVD